MPVPRGAVWASLTNCAAEQWLVAAYEPTPQELCARLEGDCLYVSALNTHPTGTCA